MIFRSILFWLSVMGISRAQDLAPDSVENMLYAVQPADSASAALFPLHSGILAIDGVRYPIRIVGGSSVIFPANYVWSKTTSGTGTLTLFDHVKPTRVDVAFVSPGKGTYRTASDPGGAVATGTITFAPVPSSSVAPLLNQSARITITSGQPSILGFVVGGPGPRRVLIRAVGPSLAQFGVTGVVAIPSLAVFKGNTQIGANAGRGGDANLAAVFASVGAFALPAASKDCAIVLTLDPGDYTTQVTANSNGEALIEVYFVN